MKIFIWSHPIEQSFCEELEMWLDPYRRLGRIEDIWHIHKANLGLEADVQIRDHLTQAGIIVLLISQKFIASDECWAVMKQAMQRKEKEDILVIPVILSPATWTESPIGKLPALPSKIDWAKTRVNMRPDQISKVEPISTWTNRDQAFLVVAESIDDAIKSRQPLISIQSPTSQEIRKPPGASALKFPPAPITHNRDLAIIPEPEMKVTFELERIIVKHLGPVATVAFSPDGELLVSDSWDNTIIVWDKDAGKELYTLKGHKGAVHDAAFSSDRNFIASSGNDGTVRIWNEWTWQLPKILSGHKGPVSSIAVGTDNNTIVSGSDDCTIAVWDIRDTVPKYIWKAHAGPIFGVVLNANMSIIASVSYDGIVKLWNFHSGQEIRRLTGHYAPVRCIASDPDMQLIVSGDEKGVIKVWEAYTGRLIQTLIGHEGPVYDVALSSDRQFCVSGGEDRTVIAWGIPSGQILAKLDGPDKAVLSVAIHPNGNRIASGSMDTRIRTWKVNFEKVSSQNRANARPFFDPTSPDYSGPNQPVPAGARNQPSSPFFNYTQRPEPTAANAWAIDPITTAPPQTVPRANKYPGSWYNHAYLSLPKYSGFRLTNYFLIVLGAIGLTVAEWQHTSFITLLLPVAMIPIFLLFMMLVNPLTALCIGGVVSFYYGLCAWIAIGALGAILSSNTLTLLFQITSATLAVILSILYYWRFLDGRRTL